MNDPTNELTEELLEDLTRPRDAAESCPAPDDAERAALREGWLAFGQLLESAERDFDEAALVERVRAAVGKPVRPAPRPGRALRSWLALVVAVAVLLAAWTGWRAVHPDGEKLARDEASPSPRASDPPSPVAPSSVGPSSVGPSSVGPSSDSSAHDAYAWNDALDERIAEMDEQLIYARGDWRGYDAPYPAVDRSLQDFSETLGDEPL